MTAWSVIRSAVAAHAGAGGPSAILLARGGLLSVIASAATLVAGIGLMALAGLLITRAAEQPPILDLMVLVVGVRACGLARPALRYAERLLSHDVTFRVLLAVRRWLVEALITGRRVRALAWRDGDVLSRLAGDVERLQDVVLRVQLPMATALLVGVGVVAGLVVVDARMAAAVAGLMVLNGVAWPLVARRWAAGLGRARRETQARLSADLVGTLQGLADLVFFGAERRALDGMTRGQQALDAIERRLGVLGAVHTGIGIALSSAAVLVVLWTLLPAVEPGPVGAGVLTAVALAVVAAFEAIEPLPLAWQTRGDVDAAARRVDEVVAGAPGEPRLQGSEGAAVPAPATGPWPLVLEGVVVDGEGRPLLRDVSFAVDAGDHVGIVGATGAGKSTLLLLVEGVLAPACGRVTLGGTEVRAWPDPSLRAHVAVLPQAVHLFNRSVRENVRLGRAGATDADVLEALRLAELRPWVDGLPAGLDTPVGERGTRLSGGERQRIGLARVFLSDARLVLLDEPTAHLDALTERAVLDTLHQWGQGRTLLLATHRPLDRSRWPAEIRLDRGRVVQAL